MNYTMIFRRYELKYLIPIGLMSEIIKETEPYTLPDSFGHSTVRNLYFDTPSYCMIRHSIEKPIYKEKLRLRSYTLPSESDSVFLELKKKYDGVVYKRRLILPYDEALLAVGSGKIPSGTGQTGREIEYLTQSYGTLIPTCYIAYERDAFFGREQRDFRITFDTKLLANTESPSLISSGGIPLLPEGMALMELKASGGIPMFMVDILSKHKIYKSSFSKYGTAYRTLIIDKYKQNGEILC